MSHEQEPNTNQPQLFMAELDNEITYIHSLGRVELTSEVGPGGSSSYHVDCHPEQARVYKKEIKRGRQKMEDIVSVFDDSEQDAKSLKTYKFLGYFVVMRIQGVASGKRIFDGSVYFGDDRPEVSHEKVQEFIEDANHMVADYIRNSQGNQEAA